ncbi:MAG TPA: transposase family protein [Aliidongia sp.]|nr:transposase family protein [Aliidongia sp.]
MSAQVTAETVATAMGVHRTSIVRRAERESWPHVTGAVRGGRQHLYTVQSLPAEIRTAVMAMLAKEEASSAAALAAGTASAARLKLAATLDDRAATAARQLGLAQFMRLPEPRQRKAEARAVLVELARRYVSTSGLPKKRGQELFAHQYNDGGIEVPAWVREARQSLCANSIDNWTKALQEQGLARLAGRQGEHRRGQGIIDRTPELREFVLGMLVEHPHASAEHVMKGIRARFVEALQPSYRTLQRWLADWKADNQQLFTAMNSPDAWRSRYQAAGGDAAAKILRLNQRWEADSTKADLLLADGTRHVVVGLIDVYSRRLKLQVSRSSSSAAVASVLRRALVDWGVPEQLGTDNGSDYVSNHVVRIVAGLGIDHNIAPPFTPEHKPFIERAFGTFCRDLVELLPGFVGHDVAQRKEIEARRSFAQRLMKSGGSPVELRMTPEELQLFCDQWTDRVYGIEPHGGLSGSSPFETAAAWAQPIQRITDERALDVLLAPAPGGDGLRTIGKKGIKLDRAWFEAPELGGLEGQDVRVLLDEADIGEIYVFDLDGKFIAKAICPERTGVSRQELAAQRKAHQKRSIAEQKKALKDAAKRANTGAIVDEILQARATTAGKLVAFPARSESYTTPDLAAAASAARANDRQEVAAAADIVSRRAAKQAEIEADLMAPAPVIPIPSAETHFARAIDIERRIAAGEAVTEPDRLWLDRYRNTPPYRARKAMLADYGDAILTA